VAELEAALQLGDGAALRYVDARAQQRRALRLHDDGSLQAFVLAGDAAAQGWVLELLQGSQPAAAFGRALLSASRQPPQALAPRSRQVCACHDVSEAAIVLRLRAAAAGETTEAADANQRLQQLQAQLKCGTECGSCLPALKLMVQQHLQQEVLTP
jgi:assimilatory nitrate reductase catalytic subunit